MEDKLSSRDVIKTRTEHTLVDIVIYRLTLPIILGRPTSFNSPRTRVNYGNTRFRVGVIIVCRRPVEALGYPVDRSLVGSSKGARWIEGCWIDGPRAIKLPAVVHHCRLRR